MNVTTINLGRGLGGSSYVKIDAAKLDALRKEIKENASARVRVGILGNKNERQDAEWNVQKLNNPTLGLIHEFGSISNGIPARSFLRMPLITKLPDAVANIGRNKWVDVILKDGIIGGLKRLGALGERTVLEAFSTRGFGRWKPNTPYTIRKKGSDAPLIDSAQLRKSITHAVVKAKGEE